MLNNFIYAETKDLFLEQLNAGNILDEAIVFIKDTREIWNHGTYFKCHADISDGMSDDEIRNIVETETQRAQQVESDIISKLQILIGTDAWDSIRNITKDEINQQLNSEGISESFDTLKEIAEYLTEHPTLVTELENSINENTKAITSLEENKANADGYYPDLHVGLSENLADRRDVIEGEISFRESAGVGNSINDGDAIIQEIEGNTVVWNQLCTSITAAATSTIIEKDNTYVCTPIGNSITPGSVAYSSGWISLRNLDKGVDKKYFISFNYTRISKKEDIGEFTPESCWISTGSNSYFRKNVELGKKHIYLVL